MRQRILAAVTLCAATLTSHAASFTPLGTFDGSTVSYAFDVSADGSVVVGQSGGPSAYEAFRWTSAGGMAGLGDLPGGGTESAASAVSADGTVVIGTGSSASSASGKEAFRWTSSGMVGLGDLPGGVFYSTATAMSADGSVVTGYGTNGDPDAAGPEAYRWTSTDGMVGIGTLPGPPFYSVATAISGDGSVIVGNSMTDGAGNLEAFRWTSADGIVGLGDLPGGMFYSSANGISADGSTIVGSGASASGKEAFRWTSADGMVGIGGIDSFATDVSADGSVIVGISDQEAFVWTQDTGVQRLVDLLVAGGTDLTGWTLSHAQGISADGQWVVGYGTNPDGATEGFRANISPVPVPAAVWLLGSALGVLGWVRRKAG